MHDKKESSQKVGGTWFIPAFIVFSAVLGGAHFWRSGHVGEAVVCLIWAMVCTRGLAWMRLVSSVLLGLLTLEWLDTVMVLVQMRLSLGGPWLRLAAILSGVAALTAGTAIFVWSDKGRAWFHKSRKTAVMQAASFFLAAVPLACMAIFVPKLMLLERFIPGFGLVQALAAGIWGAWVCGCLAEGKQAGRTRMTVWRLFSVVFFGQFLLSAAGWTVFSMTGKLHIPVPGVIVAGMLYRGTAGFMPILFTVSVLLAGAAWCSHLCYFGSWDAWAASTVTRPSPHPGPFRWRWFSLAAVCCVTLLLVFFHASESLIASCGAALGLVMIPAAFFVSRKKGWAAYCTMICPLGLVSCLLGLFSFWRIRRTSSCILCGACTRTCRYGALDLSRLKLGTPGHSCTLCRECLNVCPHGGLSMYWLGMGGHGGAERSFVVLISAMHAVFLFSAMV